MEIKLKAEEIRKTFVLHLQGGKRLNILENLHLTVRRGECIILTGPSGIGKSTLLKILYANYKPDSGKVWVCHRNRWIDLVQAEPYHILDIRRHTIGYVSQFLRVIPRVPAIEVVMEPLLRLGLSTEQCRKQAEALLTRLNIPERLWTISPTTFSGGEQQRINLARSLIFPYSILLLDEPTASLDERNQAVVIDLIQEAMAKGTAIVGVFHDRRICETLATRYFDVSIKGTI